VGGGFWQREILKILEKKSDKSGREFRLYVSKAELINFFFKRKCHVGMKVRR
jgi:hypothetical protein